MLKSWGWIGLILIILCEINFFIKIPPFILWYFPIIWIGYILFVDSLVYSIKKKSLISNDLGKLIGMFIISPIIWWAFEFFNISLNNWHYIGVESFGAYYNLFATLSFAIVIPAFFETFDLIKAIFKFEETNIRTNFKNSTLTIIIVLGLFCLILPLIFPLYFFPLIWISLFLILDPINYIRKQPNLISYFKNKKLKIFFLLGLSMLIMGFFWEFWNYYAITKWIYTIPFFGFYKIFEMPLLGYLGYIPFSFEIYSIYYFVRSLFR